MAKVELLLVEEFSTEGVGTLSWLLSVSAVLLL